MSEWIPEEEWETIVRNVPIPSVDLVVECPDGFVLGKRTNEPARGEWFVPGGRVKKGEELGEAVHRLANEELGTGVEIHEAIGTFEHFYRTSEIGYEKHYIAHGYHVWSEETDFEADNQHSEIKIFEESLPDFHDYVDKYFRSVDPRNASI
ncbi:NUDIX domain-containing protein [Natrinema versiforme]|uniref:NUDIX domain-containing protein n=1 Tax=Natrinema versiforme TaxID=88724 RepID=A0A4P8WFI1_9EURY|nr:NUDIX domain-containing protein [Natrinema versiforme]QCS42019.1 NUDIX domain-containing protein [Natrinema versiforme]